MHSPLSAAVVALAALVLGAGVRAQQYAGDVINNTLTPLSGAEIDFFKIADTSKKGGYATLINYNSAPNGQRLVAAGIQRVVIVIHGLDEDPWTYWVSAASALQIAKAQNPAINETSVAIMAPFFTNGDNKGVAYPWTAGLAAGKGSVRSLVSSLRFASLTELVDVQCTRLVWEPVGLWRR